jgi:hypothetical protein
MLLFQVLLNAVVAETIYMAPEWIDPMLPNKVITIIQGANVENKDYVSIAKAIQSRLDTVNAFVAIPQFFNSLPNPLQFEGAINDVKRYYSGKLGQSLENKDLVLVGHSLGGVVIGNSKISGEFSSIVLFASYLSSSNGFKNPVLTLGGEMDILTRLGKLNQKFEGFVENAASQGEDSALRNRPVFVLPKITHSQFCSKEDISIFNQVTDLPSVVSLEIAQEQIAFVTANFITQSLLSPEDSKSKLILQGFKQLKASTLSMLQPLIKAFELEKQTTALCVAEQSALAGSIVVDVSNTFFSDKGDFVNSKPEIALPKISTKAFLEDYSRSFDTAKEPFGRKSKNCKFVTSEKILKEANVDGKVKEDQCSAYFLEAYLQAKQLLSDAQRQRFEQFGIDLIVGPDVKKNTGQGWVSGKIEYRLLNGKIQVMMPKLYTGIGSVICNIF